MESERFEALFDAVLAIILTIIVLEIPLPSGVTLEALFELKTEFFTYLVSFIIVYHLWNSHQEIFSISNKINNKVIWINGILMFIISFLPYLTSFLANNFYSILAQSLYALEFILIDATCLLYIHEVKKLSSKDNPIQNFNLLHEELLMLSIILIGIILGILFYPPFIILACLISRIVWILSSFVTETIE